MPPSKLSVLRALASELLSRAKFAAALGATFEGRRDLYAGLGYDAKITPEKYRFRARRDAVANRIIRALPMSTWRAGMELIEDEDPTTLTAFEEGWDGLNQRLSITSKFRKTDVVAGLGRYAVLYIGVAGGSVTSELTRATADDVVFLRPYAEDNALVQAYEQNINAPRYAQPLFYNLKYQPPVASGAFQPSNIAQRVHWSRCLHVADEANEDDIFGSPRLECVWNLLDDLMKVSGGGSEAYWKRADAGLHVDIDPTMKFDAESEEELDEELEEYTHGLKRNLQTQGIKIKSLGSDVADLKGPVEGIISLISAGTGIPQRILLGSERGQLASITDRDNWMERVANRRSDFAGPVVVRPFVDRLILIGALPAPTQYELRWPEIQNLDEAQRAEVASKWADVNQKMGVTVVTAEEIRDRLLGLPPEIPATAAEPNAAPAAATGPFGKPIQAAMLRRKWNVLSFQRKVVYLPKVLQILKNLGRAA